jgi:amino acid adenylation domain-containing protein
MKLTDLLTSVAPAPPPLVGASLTEGAVHEIFRARVLTTPWAVAVSSPDDDLTYAELDRQSDHLARRLVTQHGVRQEELIPLVMGRSPRIVVAMLAVLKAGAAYVPILPTDPPERIQLILSDTCCRTVITELEFEGVVRSASASPAIFLFEHESGVTGQNGPVPAGGGASSLAYVMYTSGTSRRPKGVLIEHRGIVRLVIDAGYIEIGPNDRLLQAGSMAFDAATFEIWGALLNGASVYLAPKDVFLRPAALQDLIHRKSITVAFLTTVLFNQLADDPDEIFRGLRVLLTGGERVSARHISRVRRQYPEMALWHVYGPTENTTFTTAFPVDHEFELDVPIGAPIGHTTVSVLGPDLRPLLPGIVGELCAGGDGLSRGYLNDPALTAERFVPDPAGDGARIYRTGDLACWSREFGREPVVEFCGRIDAQMKIRGFRVEPGEIEARLREIEGIRDAAVVTHSAPDGGKSLVAYLAGDAALDPTVVRKACRESLPDYMVPADFVVLRRLPLNANGKVDQASLPLPKREVAPVTPPAVGEVDSTLQQLRRIWAEILHRADIGEDDDFFDLGGHSLTAVQMVSFVEERMGVELPINAVFDAPTLRELTQYLLDTAHFGVAALDDGMVLMDGNPEEGALFAFPPGTADCLGYYELARAQRPIGFYGFTFIESDDRVRQYADIIQKSTASEPYFLFGYSSGGNLAYHVAREIEQRGGKVASVILLDSARHLAELNITPEQMTWVAHDFLSDERASIYLTSAVLRDKARRNILRNLAYISGCLDVHTVAADIHLIAAEDSEETHCDDAGRVIVSKPAWKNATTGRFHRHQGAGGHNQMLHVPHFAENAAIVRALLEGKTPAEKHPVKVAASLSAET